MSSRAAAAAGITKINKGLLVGVPTALASTSAAGNNLIISN
jgi:hypothetical protein